ILQNISVTVSLLKFGPEKPESLTVMYFDVWRQFLTEEIATDGHSSTSVCGRARSRETFHPRREGLRRHAADAVRPHSSTRTGTRRADRGAGTAVPRPHA